MLRQLFHWTKSWLPWLAESRGLARAANASSPAYSWIVGDSQTVNWDDWCTVCDDSSDVAMDPRFLAALEDSMADVAEIKYLIGYDQDRQPVACACVSHFLVDGGILTGPWHRPGTNFIRKLFPKYLMFRIFFCGLPVSIGCNNLRFVQGCEKAPIVDSLIDEIDRLAAEQRSFLIVWKEFFDEECVDLQGLTARGYVRADSLPMNTFSCEYDDFDGFCRNLRSHYRYKIKRSQRKFDKAGLRIEHLTDPSRIEEVYTPEVHQLYLAVRDHAQAKLETLPREFFLNLTRMMPDETSLTVVLKDNRVVAFAWGLHLGEYYRNVYVGFDYSLNPQTDLYFNMMMSDLDYGIRSGAKYVFMGQSAYDFKSRLGCTQRPLSIYVKTSSRIINWLASKVSGLLIPARKVVQPRQLLKSEVEPLKNHEDQLDRVGNQSMQ